MKERDEKDEDKPTAKYTCSCGKPGRERYDNGLACGVHCNECFEEMIYQCRSRSW